MKQIKKILAVFALVFGLSFVPALTVGAVDPYEPCSANPDSSVCKAAGSDDIGKVITNVINVLLFIIGAISVVMLIIGGFRYTTSGGDQNNVKAAKDTILYAIIGLVVAFLAFAIVNWVVGIFIK